MALKIRMSRAGTKNRPYYHIVVAESRAPRDGRFIERIGSYSPLLRKDDPNRLKLVEDRIKHWLSQGALPSDRVAIFLGKAGLAPMPARKNNPQKAQPKAKAQERAREKAEKAQAAAEAAAAPKAVEPEAAPAAEEAAPAAE